MTPSLSQKDAEKIQALLAREQPCLLCGHHDAPAGGLFWPTKPEAWGGRPGKARVCGYRLCRPCLAIPAEQRAVRVEARLQAYIVRNRN